MSYYDPNEDNIWPASQPCMSTRMAGSSSYQLHIEEQPKQAKALPQSHIGTSSTVSDSRAAKRRRTSELPPDSKQQSKQQRPQHRGCFQLEPSPVIKFTIDESDFSDAFPASPYWFCTARLLDADSSEPMHPSVLRGTTTQSLQMTTKKEVQRLGDQSKRTVGANNGYFIFHDLEIAKEGHYHLQFTLQEQQRSHACYVKSITSVRSAPVEVLRSTAGISRHPSSELVKSLKDSGIKVQFRQAKEPRKSKRETWEVSGPTHLILHQNMCGNPESVQIVGSHSMIIPSAPPGGMPMFTGGVHNVPHGMPDTSYASEVPSQYSGTIARFDLRHDMEHPTQAVYGTASSAEEPFMDRSYITANNLRHDTCGGNAHVYSDYCQPNSTMQLSGYSGSIEHDGLYSNGVVPYAEETNGPGTGPAQGMQNLLTSCNVWQSHD